MKNIGTSKQEHMFGVAKYMAEHAEEYGLVPEEMYVLGLLHDIGYISDNANHADAGSRLLFKLGYKDAKYISWHETSPEEYKKAQLVEEIPKKLLLLYEADLSVGLDGEEIGFDARLDSIKLRYSEDSETYRIALDTVDYLRSLKEGKE